MIVGRKKGVIILENNKEQKISHPPLIEEDDVINGRRNTSKDQNVNGPNRKINTNAINYYHKLLKDGKLKFFEIPFSTSGPIFKLITAAETKLPWEYKNIIPKWWDRYIIIGDFRTGKRIKNLTDYRQNRWWKGLEEFWGQYPHWEIIAEKMKKDHPGEKDVIIGTMGMSIYKEIIDGNAILEIVFLVPDQGEEDKNIEDIIGGLTKDDSEIENETDFGDDSLSRIAIKENIKIRCKKLKFTKKLLEKSDLEHSRLYGLQDIPNIPKCGENVTVIDCKTGNEFPTNINPNQYLISGGLKELWDNVNKRIKLSVGDPIGIFSSPSTSPKGKHRIYVCFEYKKTSKIITEPIPEKLEPVKDSAPEKVEIITEPIPEKLEPVKDSAPEKVEIITEPIPEKLEPVKDSAPEKVEIVPKYIEIGVNSANIKIQTAHIQENAYERDCSVKTYADNKSQEITESASCEPIYKDISDLSKEIFVSKDFIEEIIFLLEEKKQIIFHGGPGTGKTKIAKEFAKFFTSSTLEDVKKHVKIIQIHPSYDYERFVEGLWPLVLDSAHGKKDISYEIKKGLFIKFCDNARKDPLGKYLLIMDEINRGHMSKILGELSNALEYRGEEITLHYSEDLFSVPENIYIIGTMNDNDKSISSFDDAWRRRFHWIKFVPDKKVLREWLKSNKDKKDNNIDIIKLFSALNKKIVKDELDEYHQIGHSFFMIKEGKLDKDRLEKIWKYDIIPLIEEYFYDAENFDSKSYKLDSFLRKIDMNESDETIDTSENDEITDMSKKEDLDE